MVLDYGCDMCGKRTVYEDIQWLTSSFGICVECYNEMGECEKREVEVKYE